MQKTPASKTVFSKIATGIGLLVCIVLIPLLIVNVTIIVKSFMYPDEVPGFLGYKPFIVLSGSMEPEFYSGDLVLVKETAPQSLKEGDIVAYRDGKSVITHRITEITDEGGSRSFVTKGDNNNAEDKTAVTEESIEGRYLFSVKGAGNVALYMQEPEGMVLFVILPVMLLILIDVIRRQIRGYKARQQAINERMTRLLGGLEDKAGEKPDEQM